MAQSANTLHALFAGVNAVTNPYSKLHYERSAHLVDDHFFNVDLNQLDTCYEAQWFRMFDEVRYMHFDTTLLPIADSVYVDAHDLYEGDTVPLGFLDYSFYELKDDALTTGNYFIFDTVNNLLSDKANRTSHPFKSLLSNLFNVSPLKRTAVFTNVIYALNPDFVFGDDDQNTFEGQTIKIDYGDGSGFHAYSGSLNSVIFEDIYYSCAGNKYLTIQLFDASNVLTKSCKAEILILEENRSPIPNETYNFPAFGMRVAKYGACHSENPQKSIIYVEGIDILDQLKGQN